MTLLNAKGLTEMLRNTKKESFKTETLFAVRTRLELVTPCVTGMYSNLLN